jgi:Fic family protein
LRNLEEYLNTEVHPVDPLIRMAVAHYQFESIHPFYDGNGRTGRIINVLYLIKEGLLESPILYLSRHIIGNKSRYYELLQTVRTDDDWEEWVLFMLASVESTSVQTLRTIELIADLMESTITLARDRLPRSTYSKELIELLFVQPYTKIEHLVDAGIAERRTASKYLKQLEEVGILTSFKSWKETIYINHELMALLRGTD